MTFNFIRREVRRRLDELNSTWWTDDEIDAAIHDGEDEMADIAEWNEVHEAITVLADRPYYDLRTTLGHRFLCAGPSFNESTNRWLVPISHRDLSNADRRWEERQSMPEYVQVRGLWWLGLFPADHAPGTQIKQYYRALPSYMRQGSDEPGFHVTFHQGIIEYAVCDLLSQDNETDLALRAWETYKIYEEGLRLYVLGRIQVPAMHGSSSSDND